MRRTGRCPANNEILRTPGDPEGDVRMHDARVGRDRSQDRIRRLVPDHRSGRASLTWEWLIPDHTPHYAQRFPDQMRVRLLRALEAGELCRMDEASGRWRCGRARAR
jgi:hypothetical protein